MSERLGPAVAGTWYPQNGEELAELVHRLLDDAVGDEGDTGDDAITARPDGPSALIAPHAGFVYSGAVAAAGFQRLAGLSHERVLLLGPSHYVAFEGAAVPQADWYDTPLGPIELDRPALDRLAESPGFRRDDGPFQPEHSLEAEMPFLQLSLKRGFRLLPILIGAGSRGSSLARVAEGLRQELTTPTLIVVSSDFTHYGRPFGYLPFTTEIPERLRELDLGAVDRIVACDRQGFEEYVARTGATICGHQAIDVLLRLLPAGTSGQTAAYDTSGRMTGDWKHSVSYASLLFRSPSPAGSP